MCVCVCVCVYVCVGVGVGVGGCGQTSDVHTYVHVGHGCEMRMSSLSRAVLI